MFVKVDFDKLDKIESNNRIWVGYYKEGDSVELVGYLKVINESLEFVHYGTIYSILPHRSFYTFISDNPQWKMERRSVNLIVRRLTGDDYFEW